MSNKLLVAAGITFVVALGLVIFSQPFLTANAPVTNPGGSTSISSSSPAQAPGVATTTVQGQHIAVDGVWECLPHKNTSGPQTTECAFGIMVGTNTHYGIGTSLMAQYPVDFPTGTKVHVQGVLMPESPTSNYNTKGTIQASEITK